MSSKAGMTYAEALAYLEGLGRFGVRPGLETIRALAARCGHPEAGLVFLHVAGTNGKGSTCAFLDAMCREGGMRVGLYTSPHLVGFRERIRVGGVPIPEGEVAAFVARARGWLEDGGGWDGAVPTFFEMVTAMALDWFARQGCEVVVWETGLGGRLDATNLVTPRVSVITQIGWDHMEWLGPTLADIAREKAGIIKAGVPVVTAEQNPEVLAVLRGVAASQGASFRQVTEGSAAWEEAGRASLGMVGAHQRWNAALALAALEAAGLGGRVGEEVRRRGLERARWPGRFQEVWVGDRVVVLDGAHNAPGFGVLRAAMAERFPGRRFGLVLGMLTDKAPGEEGVALARAAGRVVVVRVASNRGGDPEVQARALREGGGVGGVTVAESLAEALAMVAEEPLVLVAGSLYLIGEAMQRLGVDVDGGGVSGVDERRLNDWGGGR